MRKNYILSEVYPILSCHHIMTPYQYDGFRGFIVSRNTSKCNVAWKQKLELEQNRGFSASAVVKNLSAKAGNARNEGLISELGRYPKGENGNPLQYSCLENSMHRGAWRPTVHGVTKNWTWLSMHARTEEL